GGGGGGGFSSRSSGFGGQYQGGGDRKPLEQCFCFVSGVMAVVLLVAPLPVTYISLAAPESLVLSPGETRLVSRSSVVCQGMSVSSGETTVDSTVYHLQTVPKLNASNSFVLSTQASVVNNGDYEYWSFHLYPGSNYSLSACLLSSGSSVKYYTIKGADNYDNWVSHPSSSSHYISVLSVTNQCGTPIATASLAFSSEDDYYFVFYNDGQKSAEVQVVFSFNRKEYSPESGGIIGNCTTTLGSDCSLDLPYNSEYVVLIQTSSPQDGDWGTNVDISTSCTQRAWVFAVIEMGTLVIIALCAPFVLLCVYCCMVEECRYDDKTVDSFRAFLARCRKSGNAAPATQVIPSPHRSFPPVTHGTILNLQAAGEAMSTAPMHSTVTSDESRIGPVTKPLTSTGILGDPLPPDYESAVLAPSGPREGIDAPPLYD
ncbi:hypothetical protein EMCRGX_G002449, partial [Ephydatia muelleri]